MKISFTQIFLSTLLLIKQTANLKATLKTNIAESFLIVPKGVPNYKITYKSKDNFPKMFILQFYNYEILQSLPSLPSVKITDQNSLKKIFDLETTKWHYDEPLIYFPLKKEFKNLEISVDFKKKSFLKKMPFKILIAREDAPVGEENMILPVTIQKEEFYRRVRFRLKEINSLKKFNFFAKIQNCDSDITQVKYELENGDGVKIDLGLDKKNFSSKNFFRNISFEDLKPEFTKDQKEAYLNMEITLNKKLTENYFKVGLIKIKKVNKEEIKNYTDPNQTSPKISINKEKFQLEYSNRKYNKENLKQYGTLEFHSSKQESLFKSTCGASRIILNHFRTCVAHNCTNLPKNDNFYISTTERGAGDYILNLHEFRKKRKIRRFGNFYSVWKIRKLYKKINEYAPVKVETSNLIEIPKQKISADIEHYWKYILYSIIGLFACSMFAICRREKIRIEEREKKKFTRVNSVEDLDSPGGVKEL